MRWVNPCAVGDEAGSSPRRSAAKVASSAEWPDIGAGNRKHEPTSARLCRRRRIGGSSSENRPSRSHPPRCKSPGWPSLSETCSETLADANGCAVKIREVPGHTRARASLRASARPKVSQAGLNRDGGGGSVTSRAGRSTGSGWWHRSVTPCHSSLVRSSMPHLPTRQTGMGGSTTGAALSALSLVGGGQQPVALQPAVHGVRGEQVYSCLGRVDLVLVVAVVWLRLWHVGLLKAPIPGMPAR